MFFGGKFGAKRGMYVLLRWLWKWQGLVQREGQARQGCLKRVCPKFRKDAKQIKHTQTLTLQKASGIVQMQNHISTQTIAVRKVIEIVRKISLMVRMESNPSVLRQIGLSEY